MRLITNKYAKIIIYGAGDFGKKLLLFLRKRGISVDYFCQTKVENKNVRICDVEVVSVEQLAQISGEKEIFIAINDMNISHQIKLQLTNCYRNEITIYECGDFIRRNLTKNIGSKYCLMCNSFVNAFGPGGESGKLFERVHIIGGGHRENVNCPFCDSLDRERWIFYILSKYTGIFKENCKVLHFAPEYGLMQRIISNANCDYYSCDIMQGRAMHIVDVADIQFRDDTFDYIIINHVLEHIQDEEKAISELKRVLKPTGKMILSFPICTDQRTIQDEHIETDEERLETYGQIDHVRLYGYDYKERLENYGLKLTCYHANDECDIDEIEKYGFIQDDICIIATKC